jgi:hypothetical protein
MNHKEGYGMNTRMSAIFNKSMVSIAVVLTLLASPSNAEPAQASNGGKPTNLRVNGQSAVFFLDDGERYAFLTVMRDEIADTTWLSYAHRVPDLNDPKLSIQVEGDGEIPNSAFTITSSSARLTVTTPDSFFILRCVITPGDCERERNVDRAERACRHEHDRAPYQSPGHHDR